MRLRDRLASPWLTATLAVAALGLAGATAVVLGLVSLPRVDLDLSFFSYQPSHPAGPSTAPGPSPTATLAEPTFTRPTPSPEPTFTAYTVRAGDSLSSIAKTYATTPRSIAWWNRGTYPSLDPESPTYQPNRIELGWTLTILPGAVVDDNNPPTPSPPPATPTPRPSPS
jgi:LysM domain-containing protein